MHFEFYYNIIVIAGLFIAGLRGITDDGKIGYPLRHMAKSWNPYLGKPFILCSWCMASFWGSIIYLAITYHHFGAFLYISSYGIHFDQEKMWWVILPWPVCLCCISFIGGFLWLMAEYLTANMKK